MVEVGKMTMRMMTWNIRSPIIFHIHEEVGARHGYLPVLGAARYLENRREVGRDLLPTAPPKRPVNLAETRAQCPHADPESGKSWVKEYNAKGTTWKCCSLVPEACGRRWKWIPESETWEVADRETVAKEQRQALLQGVELHRKSFQKPTKEELKKDVRASFNS